MRNRKSTDAFCILVLCVAAAIVVLTVWTFPPAFDKTLYSEIGRTLAHEAFANGATPAGILVLARETSTDAQPAMDYALREIEREAARARVAVRFKRIHLDPLRPVEVPPGDFYEAIRRTKKDTAIISLLGPPVLESEQRAKLGGARPKIVAFCAGTFSEQSNLKDLLQDGFLQSAIVSRRGAAGAAGGSSFERLYEVRRSGADGAKSSGGGKAL